ncbi:MAG: DNA-3-methyladenine glycosylase, partial [Actinomycetota bacterium]
AVLLRAAEPLAGIELMRKLRKGITNDRLLAAGPARLCQAMGIDKRHNGATLLRGGAFWCAEDTATDEYRKQEIAQTVRIGLSEGRGHDTPWRFVVPGHLYASRRR